MGIVDPRRPMVSTLRLGPRQQVWRQHVKEIPAASRMEAELRTGMEHVLPPPHQLAGRDRLLHTRHLLDGFLSNMFRLIDRNLLVLETGKVEVQPGPPFVDDPVGTVEPAGPSGCAKLRS